MICFIIDDELAALLALIEILFKSNKISKINAILCGIASTKAEKDKINEIELKYLNKVKIDEVQNEKNLLTEPINEEIETACRENPGDAKILIDILLSYSEAANAIENKSEFDFKETGSVKFAFNLVEIHKIPKEIIRFYTNTMNYDAIVPKFIKDTTNQRWKLPLRRPLQDSSDLDEEEKDFVDDITGEKNRDDIKF